MDTNNYNDQNQNLISDQNQNLISDQNQNLISDQNQFPSEAEVQNNSTPNYNPPPADNYIQPTMPAPNPPIQYPPPQPPHTIYQQLNIPNPISQNNNDQSIPPNSAYTSSSGIYDYQSNIPPPNIIPNMPKPQSIEEIPPEVQQQQVDSVKLPLNVEENNNKIVANPSKNKNEDEWCIDRCCDSFCECCGACCEGFCSCLACECCDDDCCRACADCTECVLGVCQICLLCLSCLEIFGNL